MLRQFRFPTLHAISRPQLVPDVFSVHEANALEAEAADSDAQQQIDARKGSAQGGRRVSWGGGNPPNSEAASALPLHLSPDQSFAAQALLLPGEKRQIVAPLRPYPRA